MILYAAAGVQDKEIARRLDCHPEIVSRWRARFCERRIEGLEDKPRTGRPRRFAAGLGLSVIAMGFAAYGLVPPTFGALLQEAIDVAVILNALRALREGRSPITRTVIRGQAHPFPDTSHAR